MRRVPVRLLAAALVASSLALSDLHAQAKPTLTPADYGRFENLGAAALAPDGRWMTYGLTRVDETSELRIRRLDAEGAPGGAGAGGAAAEQIVKWGSGARFSPSSRWLVWSIGVSPDESARLQRERKPVRLRAGLLDLRSGEERTFDAVRASAFDATGRYLALHGYAPEEPKGKGGDLRVLNLDAGTELSLGNVADFAWSEVGSLLAVTVATGTPAGNGVQLYDARSGRLESLDGADATYRQLAWRERAADLAVLRSVRPAARTGGRHVLLAWRSLDRESPRRLQLDSVAPGLADTLMISEHYRPRWSDDGRMIAIGLRPAERDTARGDRARRDSAIAPRPDSVPTRPDSLPPVRDSVRTPPDSTRPRPDSTRARRDSASRDSLELPTMQIWHTADVQMVPQQKVQAQSRSRRTLLAVWDHAANRVVQVGTELDEGASLLEGWRHAIERSSAPYPWGTMFGRRYHDLWVTDIASGERTMAFDSVRYSWASGAGRYVLSFDGTDYWTRDVRSGERRNITQRIGTAFADTAYDTPTDLLPPHGVAGWLENDRAVLLYDEHDVWRVAPDGSQARRLTRGAEEDVTHRVVRLDRDEPTIDPDEPLYLSLHGEWNERRGYAILRPGAREPERLLYEDRYISSLRRADSAEVLLYRAEARDDSPDWFVVGPRLANARQVTATNAFRDEYAWTRAELVEYRSETGRQLQGVLLYPAGYEPGRRHPMIVYAYEILSPQMHVWQSPSERSYYNQTAWTQQGYFVLMPDIVFRARDPGVSVLETLRPAVAAVVDKGLADPQRVGFIGHSWGGYEAAYVATHSDLFAASVAGAPLTDFVSFMGQIHWNSGGAEADHWETGQARMEVPYWEDPQAHHRNSPIHNVHNMTTPLLMAHGNEDGVVEFFQATEFYNFARRAGKQMVLLVYEGEDHGFRRKPNQIDYHRRILEWFGHYLKGDSAPSWITQGVAFDDLEKEKRRIAEKQRAPAPRAAAATTTSSAGTAGGGRPPD